MHAPFRSLRHAADNQAATADVAAPGRTLVDNRPAAVAQRQLAQLINNSPRLVARRQPSAAPVQRVERQTVTYVAEDTWKKNMEIIDSTDASDYVHLSRSAHNDASTSVPAPSIKKAKNTGLAVVEDNRKAQITTLGRAGHVFPRADFTDYHMDGKQIKTANNAHITLEGRYFEVLVKLITNGVDLRDDIKNRPNPTSDLAKNLNFGRRFDITARQPISTLSLLPFIQSTANDAIAKINQLALPSAEKTLLRGAATQVRDSTHAFAQHLIASTDIFHVSGSVNPHPMVHYSGNNGTWVLPDVPEPVPRARPGTLRLRLARPGSIVGRNPTI